MIDTDKEIEVIVKPIFTKMFNSNFSACEYGIECFKKGMEYQGIKELATENDNLIEQVRILKEQIEKMKCCENCMFENTPKILLPCHICVAKSNWKLKEIKEND